MVNTVFILIVIWTAASLLFGLWWAMTARELKLRKKCPLNQKLASTQSNRPVGSNLARKAA